MKRKPEQQIITKSNRKTNINRIVVFVMLNERIINVILFGHFPAAYSSVAATAVAAVAAAAAATSSAMQYE